MRLYQNLIQYAETRGLHAYSRDQAYDLLLAHFAETYEEGKPLFKRGKVWHRHEDTRRYLASEIDRLQWIEARDRRKLVRNAIVNLKLDARGSAFCKRENLLTLEEAETLAVSLAGELVSDLDAKLSRAHENYGVLLPFFKSDGTHVRRVDVYLADERPRASYERNSGGRVRLYVTRRALKDEWLPCKRINGKVVIVDAAPVSDGVWFVQYAEQSRKVREVSVYKGAFADGQIVAGYQDEAAVSENIATIREQARIMAVTKALKGAA